MAYTKLFQSIITSSIWMESDQTRLVWITLLALADKNGEVAASIPGLARVSGISIEHTESALERFLSPDDYSRTADDEGRRIEAIPGGWAILNHGKYRAMASVADDKIKNAERQKRFRDKRKRNEKVTNSNGRVTVKTDIAEADAKADAKADAISEDIAPSSLPSPKPVTKTPTQLFLLELWEAAPAKARARSSRKQVAGAWAKVPAPERITPAATLKSLEAWKRSDDWKKDGGDFIQGLHLWIKNQKWQDSPLGGAEASVSAPKPPAWTIHPDWRKAAGNVLGEQTEYSGEWKDFDPTRTWELIQLLKEMDSSK
tara:strand:- start:3527 stop:4471 length:945 start_codon:yes stop_codon:yes gene_type:complete